MKIDIELFSADELQAGADFIKALADAMAKREEENRIREQEMLKRYAVKGQGQERQYTSGPTVPTSLG